MSTPAQAISNKEQKAKQRAKEYEKKREEKRRLRQMYHLRHSKVGGPICPGAAGV